MDPVLVLGGCRGLGHHIIKQLLDTKKALDVTAFDVRSDVNRVPGAKYIEGSITSEKDVRSVLETVKPKVIMHTVSPQLMGQKNTQKLYEDINVGGTKILLDCIAKTDCESSGLHIQREPTQRLVYYEAAWVPLFGEGDTTITPQAIANARTGRMRFQIGDGTKLFDMTYIGNFAHAHILAAEALLRDSDGRADRDGPLKVNGEAFVITNDDHWPFWDLFRAIAAEAGHPVSKDKVTVVPTSVYYALAVIGEWVVWVFSLGSKESNINRRMVKYLTMTRTFDISKAKERLGYRPQVGMQEGIKRAVQYYLEHESDKKSN